MPHDVGLLFASNADLTVAQKEVLSALASDSKTDFKIATTKKKTMHNHIFRLTDCNDARRVDSTTQLSTQSTMLCESP